jgi:predicted O-methyltransferase YrrM
MKPLWTDIEACVEAALIAAPGGHIAELGVYRGDTAVRLADLASRHKRILYAVDSFEGMAEAGPHDINADGSIAYPQGAMSVGGDAGYEAFAARVSKNAAHVRILRGWVPEVLAEIPDDAGFAFVLADLDQYRPTLDALRWAWLRMLPGGVLCCHDWFPGSGRLASRAFEEFCASIYATPQGPTASRYGMVTR